MRGFLLVLCTGFQGPTVWAQHLLHNKPAPVAPLHLSLTPINTTHVQVTVCNENEHDLSLLSWNNVFDAGAEHRSFRVSSTAHSALDEVGPAAGAVTKQYTLVPPYHFLTISAHSNWTHLVHLTASFLVAEAGEYAVSIHGPFLVAEDLSRPHILVQAEIVVDNITMNLDASQSHTETETHREAGELLRRDESNFDLCNATQISIIRDALDATIGTAALSWIVLTRSSRHRDFLQTKAWERYFGGDEAMKARVADVFLSISHYDINATASSPILWTCTQSSPLNSTSYGGRCQSNPNTTSFIQADKLRAPQARVVLCPRFFDQVPFSSACHAPKPQYRRGSPGTYPEDQAYSLLFDLLFCPKVAGRRMIGSHIPPDPFMSSLFLVPSLNTHHYAHNYAYYAATIRHLVRHMPCGRTKADVTAQQSTPPR